MVRYNVVEPGVIPAPPPAVLRTLMVTSRITVPITLVLTTLDETPEEAYRRAKRFLTERLRELADVSGPDVLWRERGDDVTVEWGAGQIEMLDDGKVDGTLDSR